MGAEVGCRVPEVITLSEERCVALLRSCVVGRVGLLTRTEMQIIPVNYSVVEDAVVMRVDPHGVLGTHAPGQEVAFEIDEVDHDRWRGWSVLVHGTGELVSDPEELDYIRVVWPPRPWAAGERSAYLRVAWTSLSGRQLGRGWQPEDETSVRRVAPGGPR